MKIILPVPQILQKPELPNGCEITSLCEILNFLGFAADKCDLADHYLPRSREWFGTDPDELYMGDPHKEDGSPEEGYYCFAGPIIKAALAYLAAAGSSDWEPIDLTGCEQEKLEECLKEGMPFIFWASLHFQDIRFDKCGGYELPGGKYHRVFNTLHCMVCCGMDEEYFYIADPLDYNEKVEKAQFMKVFRQLGSRAVILKKK
ncbi:MAG: C39 family peptidase [Oscillospiraceae bacterium]|nr:C39 family peptidase [Oscillospiraceae bacterium]